MDIKNFLKGKYQAITIVLDLGYDSACQKLAHRNNSNHVYKIGDDKFYFQNGFQIKLTYNSLDVKGLKIIPTPSYLLTPIFEGSINNENGALKLNGHNRITKKAYFFNVITFLPALIFSIQNLLSSSYYLGTEELIFSGVMLIVFTSYVIKTIITSHYLKKIIKNELKIIIDTL
ncbi:hypothetical protein R9C00_18260 [Flammeovirgaceae bacterium SG7u.111]|nr:hypothetical protein [Flammeovirgaceae bacterium SG7u.132]WPO33650.1 hypothetical protein R9C00_18260 [Flammeovirgaceae bacterium SG7u.111]